MRHSLPLLLLLSVAVGCQSTDGTGSASAGIRERLEAIPITSLPPAATAAKKADPLEGRVAGVEDHLDQLSRRVDSLEKNDSAILAKLGSIEAALRGQPAPAPAASESKPADHSATPPTAKPVPGYSGLILLSQPKKACGWCEVWKGIAIQEGLVEGRDYREIDLVTDADYDRWQAAGTPIFVILKNGRERDRIEGFDGSMPAFREILRRLNVVLTGG